MKRELALVAALICIPVSVRAGEDAAGEAAWVTVTHPGPFGRNRDRIFARWDRAYGKGNWRVRWAWGDGVLDLDGALQKYEDGYYHFLKEHPDVLEWLVTTAREVYDNAPSNVASGLDYHAQENSSNHYQDIAVRRVLRRLGRRFEGDDLVEIRGHRSVGYRLNPGQVPFHRPEMIDPTWLYPWERGSVKDFLERNRVLAVREGDGWRIAERPNRAGGRWEHQERRWNREHGEGNWRIGYDVDGEIVEPRAVLRLLEESYAAHFRRHPERLRELLAEARDVYRRQKEEMNAGTTYPADRRLDAPDVVIRRVVAGLGLRFEGERAVSFGRGSLEAAFLAPERVPFIRPGEIRDISLHWWKPGSVEGFYQSNKVLQLKRAVLDHFR